MTDCPSDGNEAAGRLSRILAVEVTEVRRRCQSCHTEHVLAEHRTYHGAALVLHCPSCDDVAVRIAEDGDALVVDWRGSFRVG